LTNEEYEALLVVDPETGKNKINPTKFYYIYEEDTEEPKRSNFDSDEAYQEAYNVWLKILSQEYMSAAWGVDIENKLGKKASSQSVSSLMAEIKAIKGEGTNPSLESLNKNVTELQNADAAFKERINEILIKYEGIEQGRLVTVEKEVNSVKNNLDNYVTKEYIQDAENDFIFVKEDDYNTDKTEFKQQLAEQVSTKEVITDLVSLGGKKLEGTDGRLQYNDVDVANLKDIPEIKIMSQTDYDNTPEAEIDKDAYYYTFDGDEVYVTKTELNQTSDRLQRQINTLFKGDTAEGVETTLGEVFVPFSTWNTFQEEYEVLANLVSELKERLEKLEPIEVITSGDSAVVTGDPERCYVDGDTVYIQSGNITM
jgi:hypothetical protein